MTQFTKDNLIREGEYILYVPTSRYAEDTKFVARFKYAARTSIGPAMTFIRKNFTVEEWFEARETQNPLPILEAKGFILSHIKKWMREAGFPITTQGYKDWLEAQRKQLA